MRKEEIQARLKQINENINIKIAKFHKEDIDNYDLNPTGCDCFGIFCLFPRINKDQRKTLKVFSENLITGAETLISGFEDNKIKRLMKLCMEAQHKAVDNEDRCTANVLYCAYAELKQLYLDILPENARQESIERWRLIPSIDLTHRQMIEEKIYEVDNKDEPILYQRDYNQQYQNFK